MNVGPLDFQGWIVPEKCSFVSWRVVIGTFVDDIGRVARHTEAVGEAGRNVKLAVVGLIQYGNIRATERGRTASQIDGHVHNVTKTSFPCGRVN